MSQNATLKSRVLQRKNLRECEAGCLTNDDCRGSLLCAKQNTGRLKALGQSNVKAYCGPVGGRNQYVCYDPLRTTSAACKEPYPQPGQKCTSRDAITCVAPPVCCRTLKTVRSNGDLVCNPRKCNFTYRCRCNSRNFACTSRQFQCIPDRNCAKN